MESFEVPRDPIERILQFDQAYDRLAYGWIGRLQCCLDESFGGGSFFAQMLAKNRARNVALLRLVLAEAAIRRHVLSEGSLPESLASLVPGYLSAVPQDPFGQGPLVYRRTADGYLLYSVGGNGTDGGGQRVSTYEATFKRKGDLFFDAIPYPPQESDNAPESHR